MHATASLRMRTSLNSFITHTRTTRQGRRHVMATRLLSTEASSSTDNSHVLHNRNLVQSRDYESFAIGLLHPPAIQPSFFALRAFHVEIASIQAKESSVASMRMKWWFDAIQSLYQYKNSAEANSSSSSHSITAIRGNPTIKGLDEAIQSHNLTQRFLERMVETRMGDLEKGSSGRFSTMKDMITFFERTHSTLMFLHLETCGVIDEEADKVANCIGIASGIVNMIRSIGCGHVGIPDDLIRKYKVKEQYINDPRALIAGEDPEARQAMQKAVKEMADLAGKYISHARKHQQDVPSGGKCAILWGVSSLRYLERLESVDYDVLEEKIRNIENTDSYDGRMWRLGHMMYLGRAHLTGVF